MKKAIYTINFGKYDSLKEPAIKSDGWDYICFTNNKDLKSDIWEIRQFETELPDHLAARYCYTQSNTMLTDYDLTIMIGGQVKCECNLNEFVSGYIDLNYDFNMLNHCRQCTYKEAEENKRYFGKNGEILIDTQMNYYRQLGFPIDYGLYAHGIIITKHNSFTEVFQKFWWNQISNPNFMYRDQLSFMHLIFLGHDRLNTQAFRPLYNLSLHAAMI